MNLTNRTIDDDHFIKCLCGRTVVCHPSESDKSVWWHCDHCGCEVRIRNCMQCTEEFACECIEFDEAEKHFVRVGEFYQLIDGLRHCRECGHFVSLMMPWQD